MKKPITSPMLVALEQARTGFNAEEVPVGAVIIESQTGKIISKAHNRVQQLQDPTAHAEILAIRSASDKVGNARLTKLDLFVTLEPCAMCAHAISLARINKLVFGAYDSKNGGVEHGARIFSNAACNHIPEIIGGVYETEASDILREFFKARR